jgi:hypothetical protein
MRIQLILILLSFSFTTLGVTDPEVKELFSKYDAIMDHKKVELIDEVFSKKFIKESGGKKDLIKKIKGLPLSLIETTSKVTWKKSPKGKFYLARYEEISSLKKAPPAHGAEFILIKENGMLKIDGTISDGN